MLIGVDGSQINTQKILYEKSFYTWKTLIYLLFADLESLDIDRCDINVKLDAESCNLAQIFEDEGDQIFEGEDDQISEGEDDQIFEGEDDQPIEGDLNKNVFNWDKEIEEYKESIGKELEELSKNITDDNVAEFIHNLKGYELFSDGEKLYKFDGECLIKTKNTPIYTITKEIGEMVLDVMKGITKSNKDLEKIIEETHNKCTKSMKEALECLKNKDGKIENGNKEIEDPSKIVSSEKKGRGRPKKQNVKFYEKNRNGTIRIEEKVSKEVESLVDEYNSNVFREIQLGNLYKFLGTRRNKDDVCKCYINMYSNAELEQSDLNDELLPLMFNISADLSGDIVMYRPSLPEDYKFNRVNFTRMREKPEGYDIWDTWMRQLFIYGDCSDESLFYYMKKIFSYTGIRGNPEKIALFFVGETGNNTKSTLVNIIKKAFGKLCKKIKSTSLSGSKGASGSADSEIFEAFKSNVSIMEECEQGKPISSSKFKEYVNPSTFVSGRLLYENTQEVKLNTKFIMCVNAPPTFDSTDDAIIRRTMFIPFVTSYLNPIEYQKVLERNKEVETYDQDELKESGQFIQPVYPIVPDFEQKYSDILVNSLGYDILNFFTLYKKEGLAEPPSKIKDKVEEYWSSTDNYKIFVDQQIEILPRNGNKKTRTESCTTTDIYAKFTNFMIGRGYKSDTIPPIGVVIHSISTILGRRPYKERITYIKFKETNDYENPTAIQTPSNYPKGQNENVEINSVFKSLGKDSNFHSKVPIKPLGLHPEELF
jgi:hypothetical protein